MTWTSKATLKTYFANGNVPTYDRYVDLIDTMGDMSTDEYSGTPATPPDLKIDGILSVVSRINLGDGTGTRQLYINGAGGQPRDVVFQSGGSNRWVLRANTIPEDGSNGGTNFEINRRDDSGNGIDTPLYITRNTGDIYIANKLIVPTVINGGDYDLNLDLGMLAPTGGVSGAYMSLRGRDKTGAEGQISIVSDIRNAASTAGEIDLRQYDGSSVLRRFWVDKAGNVNVANELKANNTSINDARMEVNVYGSGNRYAYIDFHGDDTYTDYSLRIMRYNTGPNTTSEIIHRGTGNLNIKTVESAPIRLQTSGSSRLTVGSDGSIMVGPDLPTGNYLLEVEGGVGATEGISGRFGTSSTGSTNSNNWTKIASISITSQYAYAFSHIKLSGGATSGAPRFGELYFSVKQQLALGGAPQVYLYLYDNLNIPAANVVAVTTVNSIVETRVDLYIKIGINYEALRILPLNNYHGTFYNGQSFYASLPSGTQTVSTQI